MNEQRFIKVIASCYFPSLSCLFFFLIYSMQLKKIKYKTDFADVCPLEFGGSCTINQCGGPGTGAPNPENPAEIIEYRSKNYQIHCSNTHSSTIILSVLSENFS